MNGLTGSTIENLLASQGVKGASGRGERIAMGLNPVLEASAADAAALSFDCEPAAYSLALEREKAQS